MKMMQGAFFLASSNGRERGGASTHEELNKFRARNDEEGHIGFTGHGLGEQRFAGARRAHQQHTFGDAGANGGIALRLLRKSTISVSSALASSTPATSAKVTRDCSSGT